MSFFDGKMAKPRSLRQQAFMSLFPKAGKNVIFVAYGGTGYPRDSLGPSLAVILFIFSSASEGYEERQ